MDDLKAKIVWAITNTPAHLEDRGPDNETLPDRIALGEEEILLGGLADVIIELTNTRLAEVLDALTGAYIQHVRRDNVQGAFAHGNVSACDFIRKQLKLAPRVQSQGETS